MALHRVDLIRILRDVIPIETLTMADREYAVPSQRWVAGPFAKYHFSKRTRYIPGRFDCWELAWECCLMARSFHATHGRGLNGLACGVFKYIPTVVQTAVQYSADGHHAGVIFICGKPGAERVLFFEPQRSYTVHLIHEEILSIYDPVF